MHSPVITANHRGMRSDDQSIFKTSEQESNEGKEKIGNLRPVKQSGEISLIREKKKEKRDNGTGVHTTEAGVRKYRDISWKRGRNRINLSSMDKYKASREKNL